MMRRTFLLLFLLFPGFLYAQGQNISENLSKEYNQNSYWLNLRYDHYLKTGNFFYLENNYRFNNDPTIGNSFPFNSIYRLYFMGGYEYKASDKWYMGFSEKYVVIASEKNFYTRINISHRGDFLKMKFIKEAAMEHITHPKSDNPNRIVQNEGRISFAPALIKQIKIKERPLFIIFAYRAYVLFDFNNNKSSSYSTRFIDKTRLRFELDYKLSNKFLLAVFAIRDTDYSYRLGTTGSVTVNESRVNRITPTFGLSINFIMNAPEDFIPGFPVK